MTGIEMLVLSSGIVIAVTGTMSGVIGYGLGRLKK